MKDDEEGSGPVGVRDIQETVTGVAQSERMQSRLEPRPRFGWAS